MRSCQVGTELTGVTTIQSLNRPTDSVVLQDPEIVLGASRMPSIISSPWMRR